MITQEVPKDLFEKVMARIKIEKNFAKMRQKFWAGIAALVFVFAISIPVFIGFGRELARSGFLDYASLAWSDFEMIAAYWQDFGLSLLESLPVPNAAGALAVIFVLLYAARFVAKQVRPPVGMAHQLRLP